MGHKLIDYDIPLSNEAIYSLTEMWANLDNIYLNSI